MSDTVSKRWVMRVSIKEKRRELGLGSFPTVSLESARMEAAEIRSAAKRGRDLVEERRFKQSKSVTFRQCFDAVYAIKCQQLSNKKARLQWRSTMETYVFPVIGDCPANDVDADQILEVLRPIWFTKPETARRVLQRMEAVFKSASLRGVRERGSPCIGVTQELGCKHRIVVSHRALPYAQVPAFVARLRKSDCLPETRLAFEWLIFTATRSGDARLASWSEIDEKSRNWTIPAERMKARRSHTVPLSERCLEILIEARELHFDETLIFPGTRSGRPLSDMTLTKFMRDAGVDAVPHGFRSSFRTWAGEVFKARHEVAEAALAHQLSDKTEAAYIRATYLEERRELMEKWALFVEGQYPPL